MIDYLCHVCAKISLLFYPFWLSEKIKKGKNKIVSYRFKIHVKASGKINIVAPIYIVGYRYMSIGESFTSGPGLRMECIDKYDDNCYTPSLKIGNNVHLNFNCHIGCIKKIIIDDNVLMGSNVLITDHSHGNSSIDDLNIHPELRALVSKGPVKIEHDVWIGENVSVLPNVTIGHNSIIGANTVVNKNIPPYSIAKGNPLKIL
ncbi:MAG: acyltransferase [Bacteroidales bacterium]|nr:acyltransferase [Bacteroidales bacterium]MDD4669659.1 acyltransferase [Bacteroidales bacterium]